MPARLHRAYLALHLAGWAAFVALATISGSARVRSLGLDGDSAAWLLFILLVVLVAGLPACVPGLWRSMGWAAVVPLLLAPLPAVTVLGGVFVPLAFRAIGIARVGAADDLASTAVTAGVATAPVLFLLPLVAGLVARLRRPAP
jgi:hypothetical protein